jgi:NACHT domain
MDPLSQALVDVVTDVAKRKLSQLFAGTDRDPADITQRVSLHMQEIGNWSKYTQVFGTADPTETDTVTVRLRFNEGALRFSVSDGSSCAESDLLLSSNHQLILGQPGAGKTTTLKRLVRRLLYTEPSSDEEPYQYPIVVRLREVDPRVPLLSTLASLLGVQPDDGKTLGDPAAAVASRPLDEFVSTYLNETRAVVMLDGFDEVVLSRRSELHTEIVRLGYLLTESKLLVTCRTGDYQSIFEGFSIVEICPLERSEIEDLARRQLSEPEAFLARLERLPYFDVADRPLLLTQLMFLFDRFGDLPEQPNLIYRRLVNLLLQEWDSQRKIVRRSKYASFGPERKADFLSALAFHLTFTTHVQTRSVSDRIALGAAQVSSDARYRDRIAAFTERQLRDAYSVVHRSFGLPADEAMQVITELESHTGIIGPTRLERFEFSHLSLQEYLCANYIVRDPFAPHIATYLAEYPAPIAVAICIASHPANWFASVVLKHTRRDSLPAGGVQSFLSRLFVEAPQFDISDLLGIGIMKLFHDYPTGKHVEIDKLLSSFVELPNVKESMQLGLTYYRPTDRWSPLPGMVEFYSSDSTIEGYDFPLPDAVALPEPLFKEFVEGDRDGLLAHLYQRLRTPYGGKSELPRRPAG